MKIVYFIVLVFVITIAKAQNTCPNGYDFFKVKCHGEFSQQCIPIDYSSTKCWILYWPPCPGKNIGGTSKYDTYESAKKAAENESTNWHDGECSWYDTRSYTIYIEDSNLCNGMTTTNKESKKVIWVDGRLIEVDAENNNFELRKSLRKRIIIEDSLSKLRKKIKGNPVIGDRADNNSNTQVESMSITTEAPNKTSSTKKK